MSDLFPQPQSQAQEQEQGLWSEAPAWRNLTIAAAILTAFAVAAPLVLNEDGTPPPSHVAASTVAAPVANLPPTTPPAPPAAAPSVQTQPREAPVPAPPPRVIYVPVPASAPSVAQAPAPPPPPQAVAAAQALPAPETVACHLNAFAAPRSFGAGTVIRFEDRATSLARIALAETNAGGKIDPDYVDNLRAQVHMDDGRNWVLLIPKSMVVRVGDRVTAQSSYRNATLPCNYIPNLVTADLGPGPNASRIVSTPDGR